MKLSEVLSSQCFLSDRQLIRLQSSIPRYLSSFCNVSVRMWSSLTNLRYKRCFEMWTAYHTGTLWYNNNAPVWSFSCDLFEGKDWRYSSHGTKIWRSLSFSYWNNFHRKYFERHTIHTSVATTRCHSKGRGARSDVQVGHQMSVAGSTHLTIPGRVTYHVAYLMMHLMLPTCPLPFGQTPVKTLPTQDFVCGW